MYFDDWATPVRMRCDDTVCMYVCISQCIYVGDWATPVHMRCMCSCLCVYMYV
jgi:hypothetical protein